MACKSTTLCTGEDSDEPPATSTTFFYSCTRVGVRALVCIYRGENPSLLLTSELQTNFTQYYDNTSYDLPAPYSAPCSLSTATQRPPWPDRRTATLKLHCPTSRCRDNLRDRVQVTLVLMCRTRDCKWLGASIVIAEREREIWLLAGPSVEGPGLFRASLGLKNQVAVNPRVGAGHSCLP